MVDPGSGGLPAEVARHYRLVDEDARIRHGYRRLELVRTQHIVRGHLPGGRLRIADIGGGTGVHAAWLAGDGHTARVFDAHPDHVDAARRLASGTAAVTATWADARHLPERDHSFDAALLLGPLYHLTDRADRVAALGEAARIVRPGGVIFAAAISRFASLFDGLAGGDLFDPVFAAVVADDLATGQHRNPTGNPDWFTTAYFHRPEELRTECEDAGLSVTAVLGVEGLPGWLDHLADRWDTVEGRDVILDAVAAVEAEPTLLGLSAHLIAVARTPT